MDVIFKLEYHPVGGEPHRIRFLLQPGARDIERVTERFVDGSWERVESEVIDYFEYSDPE